MTNELRRLTPEQIADLHERIGYKPRVFTPEQLARRDALRSARSALTARQGSIANRLVAARSRHQRAGGVVYFISSGDFVKIGHTKHTVKSRVVELASGNPLPLKVLATTPGPRALEQDIHRNLTEPKHRGEWFTEHARALAPAVAKNAGDSNLRVVVEDRLRHAAEELRTL